MSIGMTFDQIGTFGPNRVLCLNHGNVPRISAAPARPEKGIVRLGLVVLRGNRGTVASASPIFKATHDFQTEPVIHFGDALCLCRR